MKNSSLVLLLLVALGASAVTLLLEHMVFHPPAAQAQAAPALEGLQFTRNTARMTTWTRAFSSTIPRPATSGYTRRTSPRSTTGSLPWAKNFRSSTEALPGRKPASRRSAQRRLQDRSISMAGIAVSSASGGERSLLFDVRGFEARAMLPKPKLRGLYVPTMSTSLLGAILSSRPNPSNMHLPGAAATLRLKVDSSPHRGAEDARGPAP